MRDYALVAGACLFIHSATLIAMDRAGAPRPCSIGASFVVSLVGYVLHGRVSVRCPIEVGAFALDVYALSANIPLAFVALWLWRDLAASRIEIAAPLAIVSSIFVNFILCRLAVFGGRGARTSLVHP